MTPVPTLTTQRLTLRAPGLPDFAPMVEFYADQRSRFVGGPATAELVWRFLAAEIGHWQLRGYGRWTVTRTDSGAVVGMVGPWFPHGWPEPEIGWDLFNGHEGHGYATEAGRAALDHAFAALGWTTAVSLVAEGNTGSEAVARRLGAHPEGTFTHERFGELRIFRHPCPEGSS